MNDDAPPAQGLALPRKYLPRYLNGLLVALAATALAGLFRLSLDPFIGNRVPFATFFIAVVVAVRYGGLWSAVLTMFMGLAWAIVSWFPQGINSVETVATCIVYLLSSVAIIALGRQMHVAEALARGRSLELQDTVQGLRASQGRLQLATQVSGIGVFEWDIANDLFTGENPEAYRIFGRKPGDPKLTMSDLMARHLHPEDSARVHLQLRQAMRPGERFHVVFRNRRGDEDWRWLEVAGLFLFDGDQPVQLIGVIADISERKELEDSLRKMAADLSEADHRKDEFLATLAHELRNPLAPIRNGIELLKRSDGSVTQSMGVLGVMERQMKHMVRLVDDLIDVSRITRNKLELRKQSVDLAQVLRTAIEANQPLIAEKGHRLEVSLPITPVTLDADATRLVQVFSNLLNNSTKYTEPGGRISVIAERNGAHARVVISDDGDGIPVQMLPRVFEMFTQFDSSIERTQGGLGIGLSMVKRLVEMHGGTISIQSEGIGRGTQAEVRLPATLAPAPAPWAMKAELPPPRKARRIVVADDNHDAADSLAKLLTIMGNEVRTAYDGVDAVDLASQFQPHVVMLDIGMPRMNGHEACRRIREIPGLENTVMIAVTGWGQDEDRLRSQEAGFDLHLTKPIDPAAVESLLATLAASTG